MLNWLFGKKLPLEPPSQKQLNYARKLGVTVPEGTSRSEVSTIISKAEAANSKLARQREHVKEKQRVKIETPELKQQEAYWTDLAERDKWLIAAYRSGKNVKGGVLRIYGAYIDDKGKLKIELETAKIGKEKYLGEVVDEGRLIEIEASKILWSQVVDDIGDDVDRFRKSKQAAEREAKKFA